MLSALVFSLALSGDALACDGEKSTTSTAQTEKKSGSSCHMPQTTSVAALPTDVPHAKLALTGMHCGACADKVQAALIGIEGVKGANVDLASSTAEIAYDAKKVNLDKVVATINATGKYTAAVATN